MTPQIHTWWQIIAKHCYLAQWLVGLLKEFHLLLDYWRNSSSKHFCSYLHHIRWQLHTLWGTHCSLKFKEPICLKGFSLFYFANYTDNFGAVCHFLEDWHIIPSHYIRYARLILGILDWLIAHTEIRTCMLLFHLEEKFRKSQRVSLNMRPNPRGHE